MKGTRKGVVVMANKIPNPTKFNAQGKATEGYGPLAQWVGCTTHQKDGLVYWVAVGEPDGCTAKMQIN